MKKPDKEGLIIYSIIAIFVIVIIGIIIRFGFDIYEYSGVRTLFIAPFTLMGIVFTFNGAHRFIKWMNQKIQSWVDANNMYYREENGNIGHTVDEKREKIGYVILIISILLALVSVTAILFQNDIYKIILSYFPDEVRY